MGGIKIDRECRLLTDPEANADVADQSQSKNTRKENDDSCDGAAVISLKRFDVSGREDYSAGGIDQTLVGVRWLHHDFESSPRTKNPLWQGFPLTPKSLYGEGGSFA